MTYVPPPLPDTGLVLDPPTKNFVSLSRADKCNAAVTVLHGTHVLDQTFPLFYEKSVLVTFTAGASNFLSFTELNVPLPAGSYTATLWLRHWDTTLGKVSIALPQASTSFGSISSDGKSITGWQRVRVHVTTVAPIAANAWGLVLTPPNGNVGAISIDGFQVEPGLTATGYFNGSLGGPYSWAGLAFASAALRGTAVTDALPTQGFHPQGGLIVGPGAMVRSSASSDTLPGIGYGLGINPKNPPYNCLFDRFTDDTPGLRNAMATATGVNANAAILLQDAIYPYLVTCSGTTLTVQSQTKLPATVQVGAAITLATFFTGASSAVNGTWTVTGVSSSGRIGSDNDTCTCAMNVSPASPTGYGTIQARTNAQAAWAVAASCVTNTGVTTATIQTQVPIPATVIVGGSVTLTGFTLTGVSSALNGARTIASISSSGNLGLGVNDTFTFTIAGTITAPDGFGNLAFINTAVSAVLSGTTLTITLKNNLPAWFLGPNPNSPVLDPGSALQLTGVWTIGGVSIASAVGTWYTTQSVSGVPGAPGSSFTITVPAGLSGAVVVGNVVAWGHLLIAQSDSGCIYTPVPKFITGTGPAGNGRVLLPPGTTFISPQPQDCPNTPILGIYGISVEGSGMGQTSLTVIAPCSTRTGYPGTAPSTTAVGGGGSGVPALDAYATALPMTLANFSISYITAPPYTFTSTGVHFPWAHCDGLRVNTGMDIHHLTISSFDNGFVWNCFGGSIQINHCVFSANYSDGYSYMDGGNDGVFDTQFLGALLAGISFHHNTSFQGTGAVGATWPDVGPTVFKRCLADNTPFGFYAEPGYPTTSPFLFTSVFDVFGFEAMCCAGIFSADAALGNSQIGMLYRVEFMNSLTCDFIGTSLPITCFPQLQAAGATDATIQQKNLFVIGGVRDFLKISHTWGITMNGRDKNGLTIPNQCAWSVLTARADGTITCAVGPSVDTVTLFEIDSDLTPHGAVRIVQEGMQNTGSSKIPAGTAPGSAHAVSVAATGGSGYVQSAGSGATALPVVSGGVITALVPVLGGRLYPSAPAVTITGGGGASAVFTATLANNVIASLPLTRNGSGYTSVPAVGIAGAGSGASAYALMGVQTFGISAGGAGYLTAPLVTIGAPPAGGTQATATAVISGGVVIGFTNIFPGGGYTSPPNVTLGAPPAGGTQATATVTGLSVQALIVLAGGSGYTGTSTVTISGGGGSGATATALALSGVVSGYTQSAGGAGYTAPPNVAITGGGGSGATAVAWVSGGTVVAIIVTNPGSGYGAGTIVTVDNPPSGVTATATPVISGGAVVGVVMAVKGSGYAAPPVVGIASVVTNWSRVSATLTSDGGLTKAPALIVSPLNSVTATNAAPSTSTFTAYARFDPADAATLPADLTFNWRID